MSLGGTDIRIEEGSFAFLFCFCFMLGFIRGGSMLVAFQVSSVILFFICGFYKVFIDRVVVVINFFGRLSITGVICILKIVFILAVTVNVPFTLF